MKKTLLLFFLLPFFVNAQKTTVEFDVFFGIAEMTFTETDSVNYFGVRTRVNNIDTYVDVGHSAWLEFKDGRIVEIFTCCASYAERVEGNIYFEVTYILPDNVLEKLTRVKLSEIKLEIGDHIDPPYPAWMSAGTIRSNARNFESKIKK